MTRLRTVACLLPLAALTLAQSPAPQVFGYRDFAQQAKWDKVFMAVPDAALAGQHLKTLTAAPTGPARPRTTPPPSTSPTSSKPPASKPRSSPTKFSSPNPSRSSSKPSTPTAKSSCPAPRPSMSTPTNSAATPSRTTPASSPPSTAPPPPATSPPRSSTPTTAPSPTSSRLAKLGISVKGKIVLVRYGENFRGIKTYIAQQYGAVGVLIYSDPADDGYFRGDIYPRGPYRPETAVQRGSIQFLPIYPGDPTTPGVASTPDLPDSKRIPIDKLQNNQPTIPTNPLSYHDAAPILKALGGAESPATGRAHSPSPITSEQPELSEQVEISEQAEPTAPLPKSPSTCTSSRTSPSAPSGTSPAPSTEPTPPRKKTGS
ncbi:hypothetical protein RBB78_20810 [Tunturiibacter empetritectus]|uniref:PA domain-containing protein n=1 Tax=Tunturiibacter empetritectus TaxID=3069691 RepID=UPI003D9BD4BC